MVSKDKDEIALLCEQIDFLKKENKNKDRIIASLQTSLKLTDARISSAENTIDEMSKNQMQLSQNDEALNFNLSTCINNVRYDVNKLRFDVNQKMEAAKPVEGVKKINRLTSPRKY